MDAKWVAAAGYALASLAVVAVATSSPSAKADAPAVAPAAPAAAAAAACTHDGNSGGAAAAAAAVSCVPTDAKTIPTTGNAGTKNERSFIALKPDAVQRGLIGKIIARFEEKGFKLVAMKFLQPTLDQAKGHYDDLKTTKFFAGLTAFFSSGPIVAMVWEGEGVIAGARKMMGATKPAESNPGTIRGDFCVNVGRNIIHGSDSPAAAAKEIAFWFKPEEVITHTPTVTQHIYE